MQISSYILSIVTFTPAVGALLLLFQNRANIRAIRTIALTVSVLAFVFSLHLIAHFETGAPGFQYVVDVPWISAIGIHYYRVVDGISVFLILI